nr:MAG TPA: Serine/threonine-protein phosphatase [Caudoviricetes sp.]
MRIVRFSDILGLSNEIYRFKMAFYCFSSFHRTIGIL